MKKVSNWKIGVVLACVVMFLGVLLWIPMFLLSVYCGCQELKDNVRGHEKEGAYEVCNLDAGRGLDNGSNYYYIGRELCSEVSVYSLEDGIQSFIDKGWICTSVTYKDDLFYIKFIGDIHTDNEVWRYSADKGEKKMVYTGDVHYQIQIYEEFFLYYDSSIGTYICPVNGDFAEDRIEVNDLFPEEDKSGETQTVVYEGIEICRHYTGDGYRIDAVREEGHGKRLLMDESFGLKIKIDGKWLSLRQGYNDEKDEGYWYQWAGEQEEYKIECLDDRKYQFVDFEQQNVLADDDEVIALLAIRNFGGKPTIDGDQDYRKKDVLFSLNPNTGESKILYEPQNNRTRIIGYRDGRIYFMREHKIWRYYMDSGGEEELFELPEGNEFVFDWQAGYLIIMDRISEEVLGAYKLE